MSAGSLRGGRGGAWAGHRASCCNPPESCRIEQPHGADRLIGRRCFSRELGRNRGGARENLGGDRVAEGAQGESVESRTDGQNASRRRFLAGAVALGGAAAGMGGPISTVWAEPARGGAQVNPRLFSFVGGAGGLWSVVSAKTIVGDPLPAVERLDIVSGTVASVPDGAKWVLRGVTSNARYLTRDEKDELVRKQAALGRTESTCAALIPIRKSAKWWDLTQDERRAIFEERSHHNAIGVKYLPGVARRLHHCRDLGETEPFDFLTLFDYAPGEASAFDDLVAALRATEEWKYVEREVDLRLVREG